MMDAACCHCAPSDVLDRLAEENGRRQTQWLSRCALSSETILTSVFRVSQHELDILVLAEMATFVAVVACELE